MLPSRCSAAKVLGAGQSLGTLQPGQWADSVGLDAGEWWTARGCWSDWGSSSWNEYVQEVSSLPE